MRDLVGAKGVGLEESLVTEVDALDSVSASSLLGISLYPFSRVVGPGRALMSYLRW